MCRPLPRRTTGEIFITMAKEGSTIGGIMDSFGTALSIALQYGVPLGSVGQQVQPHSVRADGTHVQQGHPDRQERGRLHRSLAGLTFMSGHDHDPVPPIDKTSKGNGSEDSGPQQFRHGWIERGRWCRGRIGRAGDPVGQPQRSDNRSVRQRQRSQQRFSHRLDTMQEIEGQSDQFARFQMTRRAVTTAAASPCETATATSATTVATAWAAANPPSPSVFPSCLGPEGKPAGPSGTIDNIQAMD